MCLKEGPNCYLAKSDLKSAFRHLPIRPEDWRWLVMKAFHPESGRRYYMIDKCTPFGSRISCSHFQRWSNAIEDIFRYRSKKKANNYLDDFLFAALQELLCNGLVDKFLWVCKEINFPVTLEKAFRASQIINFLGMLLSTKTQTISIPGDKKNNAIKTLTSVFTAKKIMVLKMQQLAGLLNFIGHGIYIGRAYTRRFYSKIAGKGLKQYHHII